MPVMPVMMVVVMTSMLPMLFLHLDHRRTDFVCASLNHREKETQGERQKHQTEQFFHKVVSACHATDLKISSVLLLVIIQQPDPAFQADT
jgi:hypothetical protein